jgi:predicted RNase H-like HicB family nuclease
MSRYTPQLSMILNLEALIRRKGKWHIARCDVFDVVTQGETAAKALANLKDAMREFLLSCFERGTIDEVLKDAGLMPVAENFPSAAKNIARKNTVPLAVQVPLMKQMPAGHAPQRC